MTAKLSDKQISNYKNDGVILIKEAFLPWIEKLKNGFQKVLNNPSSHGRENISKQKGGRFFEFEAGGSNLAIAVAAIIAIMKEMNNNVLGIIFLIYAIYLFMGSLAWYIFNPKDKLVFWLLKFWAIGGAFAYFSYVAFTN